MTPTVADVIFEQQVRLFGYGPYLWQVCDGCNYNLHRCHFCGDDLTHAEFHGSQHYIACRPDLFDEEGNYIA